MRKDLTMWNEWIKDWLKEAWDCLVFLVCCIVICGVFLLMAP